MKTATSSKRVATALTAAALISAAAGIFSTGSAGADPAQYSALVGVGSDTTQDVLNALAGKSNGVLFTPIQSSAATGGVQVISFDATPPPGVGDTCITPKLGAPTFTRPNGSSAGQRALSRAIDGAGYGGTSASPIFCAKADVSGQIDFGRTSSLDSTAGTQLAYVPFARDALTFAYYRANGAPVTELTAQQLNDLHKIGPQTINGVRIVACGIQSNSGTYTQWRTAVGVTTGEDDTGTALCRGVVNTTAVPGSQSGGRLQESNGVQLKQAGDLVAALAGESGTQVIIGYSAGAFVSRQNGFAIPAAPAGVSLGTITGVGAAVTGTAPNLAPNAAFYANTTWGRTVYNMLPSSVIDLPGNLALKDLFVGSSSKICQATATINAMGFLADAACGDTTIRRGLRSGDL
jgi:ABC-type phosphate transport system substrate-binding protein